MEIGQLEAFERAAREGSFTRVADELGLTQPSVSARIAGLEKELGGALFERGGKKLRLTALGQQFLPYAERALAVLADGLHEVENFHAGKLGQISIAALDTLAMMMLAPPLENFRDEHPAVDFSIKLRLTRQILDMLHDGTATLGLIGAPLFEKEIAIEAHFQAPLRAVVSSEHPLAKLQQKQGILYLSDLHNHTIFRVPLGPRITAFADGLVESARRGSGGAIVSIPSIMVTRMVILGQGLAFMPESYLQHHIESGLLHFLDIADMPKLYVEALLVSLRGRQLDLPNQKFVQIMKAHWQHILVFERHSGESTPQLEKDT